MTFIRTCIVFWLLGAVTISAGANTGRDLKKAQLALAEKNYERAFQLYSHVEQTSRHPLAQFSLAFMHQQGLGRPADTIAACRWFAKAAQGGIPTAAHEHAECLRKGVGKEADPDKAAIWYRKAGELGSYASYCSLGRLYMAGLGVEKSPQKALELCQLAAEKGAAQAVNQVARWRLEGEADIRDSRLALEWFKKGAELNLAESEFYLGQMIRAGMIDNADLIDARYWYEKAATQGYSSAYLPAGKLYLTAQMDEVTGLPSARDLAKSYLWLSAAARRSDRKDRLEAAELLRRVDELMPQDWKADLNPKIEDHLNKF